MSAKELLREEWLDDHERIGKKLFDELGELSTRLFLVKTISDFPFSLFAAQDKDVVFWVTVRSALIDSCVSIAYRAIVEKNSYKGKQRLSLKYFRDAVVKNAKDDPAKKAITARLKEVEFDRRLEDIERKVEGVRHRSIGHLDLDFHTKDAESKHALRLTIDELDELGEAALRLLGVLVFGPLAPLPLAYHAHGKKDIERILECVALNSYVLNLPEQNPYVWTHHRTLLSEREIEQLNHYRRLAHLPEVD
jgi:hypothetical protein